MRRRIGSEYLGKDKTKFTVWAPFKKKVQVVLKDKEDVELKKNNHGYWVGDIKGVLPGSLYKYRLDGEQEFPDPASRSQPLGVHSWSQVIDSNNYSWGDKSWKGLPLSEMIIYELHVGTFTPDGTFEAVIDKLDHLLELGINTIEILPISQFPGERNWGYDGVYPYAAQHSYGGVYGLKKMIDACHQKGIAVILDAVYNHMGPEGNYLREFGPYFTEKYHTPWGAAINFDDKHSDEVRNFFLENARMWLEEFHFDGLRLDAIHEIIDRGARHLLREMSQDVDKLQERSGRQYVLIAESDLNDVKVVNSYDKGGFGLEGQWVDDFHHALHTLLTGEEQGYYSDYGKMEDMAKAYRQAFIYDGAYSKFRKRTVGNSPMGLDPSQFVICIQNHDQVGNRILGDRLSKIISFEKLKLAAGVILTAPFVPMLFMGEEFAEDNPFQYFVSHGDKELVKAVQEGRKREFKYFFESIADFPDPQGEETFQESKINWNFKEDSTKKIIFNFYKKLIQLRKEGTFDALRKNNINTKTDEEKKLLSVFAEGDSSLFIVFNFNEKEQQISLPKKYTEWEVVLASADKKWGGAKEISGNINASLNFKLPGNSLMICKNLSKPK